MVVSGKLILLLKVEGVVFISGRELVSEAVLICSLKTEISKLRAEVTVLRRKLEHRDGVLRHYCLRLRKISGMLSYLSEHPYSSDKGFCGRKHSRDSKGRKRSEVFFLE